MKFAICAFLLLACVYGKFLPLELELKPYTDEMHAYINSIQSDWQAGHNTLTKTKSPEQIKKLLGTFLDTPEDKKLPLLELNINGAIPEEFDSRTAWPNCESIKEVRDQSNCGSCWAFGAVEAMSDRICVASKQTLQTRLSSNDLVACCGFFTCGMGCNGGYPSGAWKYWVRDGITTGGLYGDNKWCQPYTLAPCDHHVNGTLSPCQGDASTPKCTKACVNGQDYTSQKVYGSKSYSISSNVQAIQTEIQTNGPVEGAFTVYEDFPSYKSGVYSYTTGSQLGGHAIKILGWGVENGTPYWLCANSWNEDWGDKGFFKIRRGTNECGIEGSIVAGLPKL